MYCPRLNHFVRLNQNGSIGKCGHMTNAIGFKTFKELDESEWLNNIKEQMSNDKWPDQCVRCKQTEEISGESIRTKSIDRHKVLHKFRDDYLVVGGVLDNVCNSACQSCNAGLSTKIGSLTSKEYPRVNNIENFYKLPQDRILEVVQAAKDHNCSIRIGVNAGSLDKALLEKYKEPCPDALVESAMYNVKLLEDNDFFNFKISVKSSDVFLAVKAYEGLS